MKVGRKVHIFYLKLTVYLKMLPSNKAAIFMLHVSVIVYLATSDCFTLCFLNC